MVLTNAGRVLPGPLSGDLTHSGCKPKQDEPRVADVVGSEAKCSTGTHDHAVAGTLQGATVHHWGRRERQLELSFPVLDVQYKPLVKTQQTGGGEA